MNEEMMVPEPTIENVEENKVCHFKILLSDDIIEALTGDNGEALQNLQKDTNSKITISKNFEYFPGSEKRVCLITGTVDVVFKVLFFIIDIIKDINLKIFNRYVEFVVPDSTARLIIGEKEQNLHQIRAESQAYVRMYRKENYPSPNESCFVVKDFHMGNIAIAFSMILNKIALDPENGSFSDITYQQFSPASNPNEVPHIEDSSLIKTREIVNSETLSLTLDSEKDEICHLKVGVNRKILKSLQDISNSKVTISKKLEYFPDTSEHTYLMTGTVEEVLKALFFIINFKIRKSSCGSEMQMKFVMPDSMASLIINEREKNSQQIMEKSKGYIEVHKKEEYPPPKELCLVVRSHDFKFMKTAFVLILKCISSGPNNRANSRTKLVDMALPASNCNEISINEDLLQRAKKRKCRFRNTSINTKKHQKNNTCHLKILLKRDFAETVTGNIEKLQEDSNSKVNISKEFEYFPGTHKRVCSIAGTTHAVLKALFSIMDFTESSPFIVGYEVQVEFVVPFSTSKIINNSRQLNMRQVMMHSKACLRICNKVNNHLIETVFMVRSIGEEFVRAALSLIVEYVILDPENGTCINVIYPNVSYLAPEQRKLLSSVEKIIDLPTHPPFLNRSKANKICDLKILLKNFECEALIGDKGETLEKLKTYSNSTVTISKELEYFAGTTEFTCHIAGAAKAVLKALLFIIDIKNRNTSFGSAVKMVFVLPHSIAKLLIGNKEDKLQQIKTQSKAYIRMYNKKDYPSPTEACFIVRSIDIEFIRTAFVLIIDCITSNSGNDACHSLFLKSKLPEPAKIDRYANISSIAEGQDDCWSNENYRYQMNENYVNCAGVSSQYNYEYPIAGGYDSNFAENEHPVLFSQKIDGYSSHSKYNYDYPIAGGYDSNIAENKHPVLFSQKIDEYSSHSQYNYEYPIAGGYDSNFAENKHPVLFSQKINEYPSHEVSEYSFKYVSNEHKESTQLTNPFSRQDVKDYESGSQIAGKCFVGDNQMSSRIPSRDSGYEYHLSKDSRQRYSHRSRSPSRYNYKSKSRSRGSKSQRSRSVSSKRRLSAYSSRKRSRSRTKSTENQSNSLRKRSHEGSRSINRNYRKRKSFSRSLSKTRNYRRRRSSSRSLSKTRNYRRRRSSSRSLSDSRARGFQSRCKKSSPKISDKSSHHNSKTGSEFSVIGALNLLETVCDKYGILSEIIKPFITIIKSELEIDKCKALRLTKDDNNLLELIVNRLISLIASAPSEEIEMLSKAVDWTNDLIEQARKAENSESDINIRAIAYSRSRSRSSSKRSSDSQDRKRHSKYKRKTSKAADKSDHFDDVKVGDEFSLIGALNLLEKACDNYKELRKIIKRFTAIIRSELEVDRSKALRLIKGESILLKMIVNKLKSRLLSAPLEEIGMLSKTIEWTNDLIEHARKAENSESDINIRAIAYSRSRSRSSSKRSSHSQDRNHHSRDGGKTPSKHVDKYDQFDDVKVGDDFSVSGAIYLLERVCDKCGTLGEWLKTFTTLIKSEVDDRSKTSKIIEDENNIHFLGMIINKLKSCTVSASVEESEMISKAAEWTAHLIEYIENFKKPEIKVDFKAIAEASINKTPDSIIDFIKMAFLYSGISNPTEEDISEAFVKVSELQFKMTINDKS